jgi:hypothetical protein
MTSYTIIIAKKNLQRATHEVKQQYKAAEAAHNWGNKMLEDRASKIKMTEKRQCAFNLVTCAGVVVDLAVTGGLHSLFLVSTKAVAHIHFKTALKRHIRLANEVLESERTVTLELLRALKDLDRACSRLRDIGRLPSHTSTESIVEFAFSPGGRTVLTELAFEGIHGAFHKHHGAVLDMGISDGLIEVFGQEITESALGFVSDVLPLVGIVSSILHLAHAIKHAGNRSEEAEILRGIVVTRKKNFKAMTDSINHLSDCANALRHDEACAVVVMVVVMVAIFSLLYQCKCRMDENA